MKKSFDIPHVDDLAEMDLSDFYKVLEDLPSDVILDCLSLEFISHNDNYSQTILSMLHELQYRIINRYYIRKEIENGK